MTAWALGPRDKSEIVARFLPELQMWSEARANQLWKDVQGNKQHVEELRLLSTTDRILTQSRSITDLARSVEEVEKGVLHGGEIPQQILIGLRRQFNDATRDNKTLRDEVARPEAKELKVKWDQLLTAAHEVTAHLLDLEQARTPEAVAKLQEKLKKNPAAPQRTLASLQKLNDHLDEEKVKALKIVTDLAQSASVNAQRKYDVANKQTKQMFSKTLTAK